MSNDLQQNSDGNEQLGAIRLPRAFMKGGRIVSREIIQRDGKDYEKISYETGVEGQVEVEEILVSEDFYDAQNEIPIARQAKDQLIIDENNNLKAQCVNKNYNSSE